MIIRGTVIPLGKINRAKNPWGILNSTTEINRLLKSMEGKPVKFCKECVSNPNDAHACDIDPNATVGTIRKAYYNREENAIGAEAEITDTTVAAKINSGVLTHAWSPGVVAVEQDENGFLHGNDFENLTLVGRPAFDDATYSIVRVAEAGDDDTSDEDDTSNEDDASDEDDASNEDDNSKKKGKLDVNKKKQTDDTITIKKEDLAKLVADEIAKSKKADEEAAKKNTKKNQTTTTEEDDEDMDDNTKPNGQFLTREQMDEILEQKKMEGLKEAAVERYEEAALNAGVDIDEDDLNAIKQLPLKQIQKLTKNYVDMSQKIPVEKKKSNKPTYYDKQTGTGGIDGSVGFTVGYPDDNGNWQTDYK